MAIFYTPDISDSFNLPEEESLHAVRVLRLKEGDLIELIDGKGNFFEARIVQANPKKCMIECVRSWKDETNPFFAHIAVAPTKNADRIEWFVEKATEVGIAGIAFIQSKNSERKVFKQERLEKIVVSAMKQSQKALKPKLQSLIDFKTFVGQKFEGDKFICHCNPGEKPLLLHVCKPQVPTLILIGPEGDFSPDEVELAAANGFMPVSLGETRLRTETAAFVASHIVELVNHIKK